MYMIMILYIVTQQAFIHTTYKVQSITLGTGNTTDVVPFLRNPGWQLSNQRQSRGAEREEGAHSSGEAGLMLPCRISACLITRLECQKRACT